MNRDKKILAGYIIIIFFIIFGSIFLFIGWNKGTTTATTTIITTTTTTIGATTTTTITYENPRLIKSIDRNIEIISENSNLIFKELPKNYIKSLQNFKFINMYETPETFYPWKGDAAYFLDGYPPGIDKEGVVSVHPFNITTPSYLFQDITLGNDDYIIVATIANIGNLTSQPCADCNDNIFIIKIIDLGSGSEEKIYENEINAAGGWRTIYLNISDYKNKNIRFVIEGHAGGMCGDWCAEFGAVDEFYIGRLV